jgi:hypothetical protein
MRDYTSLARPPRRSVALKAAEPICGDDDVLVPEVVIQERTGLSRTTLYRLSLAGVLHPIAIKRAKRYWLHKTMAALRAMPAGPCSPPAARPRR